MRLFLFVLLLFSLNLQVVPYFRGQLTKTAAVSLLAPSDGSHARGTGELVTLAAAVEGVQSKLTVRILRAHLSPTADIFSSKSSFHVNFST